jgi:UbiD family decarboxylase
VEDLRGWIDTMRGLGLVKDVRGAGWNLEVGPLTDMNAKRGKWVLLFDEIDDYPAGRRIVTGTALDSRRVGHSLNLGSDRSDHDLVTELRSRLYSADASFEGESPTREVPDGPLFENSVEGDAIDLFDLPSPLWHEQDAGRYLGTFDAVVTRDPEDGWVNVGAYRMMVHSPRELCLFVNASHHGRLHIEKYERRGERAPVAVSLGHQPALSMLAGLELPIGVSEFDVVSQLRGEPVEVVRAPVTGLPVPAHSEVVVEGYMSGEVVPEGPYGEFLGYYAGEVVQTPTVHVEAIHHRDDPILLGTCSGIPPYDYSYFRCPMRAAMIWEALDRAGVGGVTGVWCHEAGYSRALNVVAIDQAYHGHAKQAGLVASQSRAGAFGGKYTIVVDGEIDPADLDQVMWAVCTRTDPGESIDLIRDAWGMALDPMVEREPGDGLNQLSMGRAIIDACRPFRRLARGKWPDTVLVRPELAERLEREFPEVFAASGALDPLPAVDE